jgi:hypothetical protein
MLISRTHYEENKDAAEEDEEEQEEEEEENTVAVEWSRMTNSHIEQIYISIAW